MRERLLRLEPAIARLSTRFLREGTRDVATHRDGVALEPKLVALETKERALDASIHRDRTKFRALGGDVVHVLAPMMRVNARFLASPARREGKESRIG